MFCRLTQRLTSTVHVAIMALQNFQHAKVTSLLTEESPFLLPMTCMTRLAFLANGRPHYRWRTVEAVQRSAARLCGRLRKRGCGRQLWTIHPAERLKLQCLRAHAAGMQQLAFASECR